MILTFSNSSQNSQYSSLFLNIHGSNTNCDIQSDHIEQMRLFKIHSIPR
jgi:hypothetical protein